MTKMIFVNLPVTNVARSTAFYEAMGATKVPDFSNDDASMMRFSEVIHVMVLSHAFYSSFTTKPVADAHTSSEVMIALSADSRDEVDRIAVNAGPAGGRTDPNPIQDHGFMYGRSFEDPDGHIFEVMWMDMAAQQETMAKAASA